ncbi:ROK family protein [Alicyclobacillus fastidiosus]|uniref:ROK family protein n=1 Tax=Alicyclobacillus fastidiosus TaxID=392011 RepID=A0ABY6ZBE8_9BACL|nr:ROK family protein [Alicyclobacillus fastidiosus]WAH40060.1 ROK family protein [Alicyclobacillus fastidiosus]GMA61367.1 glucokinase [Alicyclobacillus fastidiosus]
MESVIGIDIGGTNIRVGLIDDRLNLIRKETALTDDFNSIDELFRYLLEMIEKVNERESANKIGIALPIPWRGGTERLYDATNISYLEGFGVRDIPDYFPGYGVYLENDVNVVAILESAFGASKEYANSMYITVSTGIGSGVILNNEIYHGAHGYAGEVGSIIISDSKTHLSVDIEGSLESLCIGAALEKVSKSLFGHDANAKLLFEKQQEGDVLAVEVIEQWIDYFSRGIASLFHSLDPDVIVLGGSVIQNNQWLIQRIEESAKNRVLLNLKDKVKILISRFGDDAGLIGAGYVALKKSTGGK